MASEILLPVSDVNIPWIPSTGAYRYAMVDEGVDTHDGLSSYIRGSSASVGLYQDCNTSNPGAGVSEPVTSIRMRIVAMAPDSSWYVDFVPRVSGIDIGSMKRVLVTPSVWTEYTDIWYGSWTKTELNNLSIAIGVGIPGFGSWVYCTAMQAEISDSGAQPSYDKLAFVDNFLGPPRCRPFAFPF